MIMKIGISVFAFLVLTLERTSCRIRVPVIVKTSQSGVMFDRGSEWAVDKDINTCSFVSNVSSSDGFAWWRGELDKNYIITKVYLSNTPNTSQAKILSGLKVFISKREKNFEKHECASVKSAVNEEGILNLTCSSPIFGKFVTVKRSVGVRKDLLVLCEVSVEAEEDDDSKSFNQPTSQSGILFAETSPLAVDGDKYTCTKVRTSRNKFAWWRVSLTDISDITHISIFFNSMAPEAPTMTHFSVFVSTEEEDYRQKTCERFFNMSIVEAGWINLTCTSLVSGKYVTIQRFRGIMPNSLFLCEVYIYGAGKTNSTCNAEQVRCEVLSNCLPKEQICDRIVQCPDGSDEINCTCLWLEYKCKDGKCINKEWLCDGVKDCPNGDDEEAKSCVTCKKGQFKCLKDNVCLYIQKRCDGIADCQDQSDERGCLSNAVEFSDEDTENEFLKATFKGASGYFICSSNWGDKFSLHACQDMGSNIHETTRFTNVNASKIIGLKASLNDSILDEMLPFMTIFEKKEFCKSNTFVEIVCPKVLNKGCGIRAFSDEELGPYIVHGDRAKLGAWPWHVQIVYGETVVCGGSLIHKKWVLTSASCLATVRGDILLKLGTNIANDAMVKNYSISHFMLHPNFDPQTLENNIALIKLNNSIRFTNTIKTICLPNNINSPKQMLAYRYCVVTGLGRIAEGHSYSRYLLQGKMNIMTYKKCAENLQNVTGVSSETDLNLLKTRKLLCAGSPLTNYGINICKGDNGGPLVCKNDIGRWTQVGIASHSYAKESGHSSECADSVFTRVDLYLNYIMSQLYN